MADPLETEVGRFEYYKKKFEAEKANIPQLSGVAPNVLDIARKKSNQWEFPPFGLINFKDVPNGLDEERFVSKKVDDVLRGTVKYVHELEGQSPEYLNGWGITDLPLFENSAATKNLVAKTKTDYSKIVEEMDNLESGYETDFKNKEMKKLTSRDLHDLLDGTMLDFLKEIGVNRSGGGVKQNDDLILESSQKIYEFLTKGSTPAQPAAPVQQEPPMKTQETVVKVKETQKIEPVPTAPVAPASPVPPQTTQTATVVEKSQPPIEPAQPVVPVQNTTTANPANIATPETADQSVVPPSSTAFTETGSAAGSASASTPLLDLLGASSGMSSDDIAKMFQGEGGMEKLQQGLDLSFPGSPIKTETIAAAVGQTQPPTTVQQQNATANAPVATKTAEPAKIAEAIQAPPAPPQTPAAPVAPPEAPKEAPTPPVSTEDKGKEEENAAAAETKQAEETKSKEQDQTNAELLKVMKDILKALHGPLIVTDGKHNFS